MENVPFEDVFLIERVDIPASYVSLPEGRCWFRWFQFTARNLRKITYLVILCEFFGMVKM